MAAPPLTPANMRRDLRRHLQACERQWVRGIVPTQNDVFLERFWERIKSSRKDAEWKPVLAESITALQPDFLRPWKPIEDLGFDAIEAEGQFEASAPKLFEALEHAYALSTRDEVRQAHSTVVGHGQLLALRTWTLWGAYALSCENWAAVEALLHEQVSFITPRLTKPYRASFAEHKGFLYPDAAGHSPGRGVGDLAAQSIYSQPEQFAEEHFLDLEEMRTYIGLWLLASEIAYVTGESHLFWSIAPRSQLQRIIDRLEADSDLRTQLHSGCVPDRSQRSKPDLANRYCRPRSYRTHGCASSSAICCRPASPSNPLPTPPRRP